MEKKIIILIGLVVILFAVNYSFLDSLTVGFFDEGEVVVVERVIDGDTFVVGTTGMTSEKGGLNTSVRLLGINSPEKGEQYYEEAKEFLEEAVINKNVRLGFGKEKKDKYDRILAYVFVGGENINLKLVEEGFANFYFPSGRDIYYEDFKKAWEECSNNLCEMSENKCIVLKEFDYEEEVVVFYNKCGDCDLTGWEIKDEGRKSFVFPDFVLGGGEIVKVIVSAPPSKDDSGEPQAYPEESSDKILTKGNELVWERNDYVWTDSGDTLFLRDGEGKLVLWESY